MLLCLIYVGLLHGMSKRFENDPDGLIPALTDGETEAQREDGTCPVAG